jgi:glycerol-3-phosphate acyltransferase PlsX
LSRDQRHIVRVALDAMGGDNAPAELVLGAVEATRMGGVTVLLVGDQAQLQKELNRHAAQNLPITIVPSEGVIRENESPVQALRQKPKASVAVATTLVKEGKADGCVSMGSTGAMVAAATFLLGPMKGLERPALGGPLIGLAPKTVILDVGTNVDCRPSQLLQFAAIGSVFSYTILGVQKPRVALLSVGSEEGKGNRQVRETYALLAASGLNFVGNVEGHDLPAGKADVVVCDGFTGNVLMKFAEGIGHMLSEHLQRRLKGKLEEAELAALTGEVYDILNQPELLGGGPLYGINGLAIVGHGGARSPAVAKAIHLVREAKERNLISHIQEELSRLQEHINL